MRALASEWRSLLLPSADVQAFSRARRPDMAQRGLDGAYDQIQAQINQIHPRQREHQVATNDHACIEHVIDQIEQGEICGLFITKEDNLRSLLSHRSIQTIPVANQIKTAAKGRYIRLSFYLSIFSRTSG